MRDLTGITKKIHETSDFILELAHIIADLKIQNCAMTAFINANYPKKDISKPHKKAFFTDILSTKVSELPLPVRILNIIKSHNSSNNNWIKGAGAIIYLADLVRLTEYELLKAQSIGMKSLKEIKEVLAEMGLHLGMEV